MKNSTAVRRFVACAVVLACVTIPTHAQQNPKPMSNNLPVDNCLHWAADCGKPAADQYCRDAGYPGGSDNYQTAHMHPTWVLGDNKVCDLPTDCVGFASIQCRGNPGPKLANGYSVDNCLHWAANCGKPAADRFCRVIGHPGGSTSFQTGHMHPTWVLGDSKVCNPPTDCVGFISVQCSNAVPID